MSIEPQICEAGGSRQGGVFAYVSASRLNRWLACPLRFRLEYVDGIRPPATPSLFLGKAVHAALERVNRQRQHGRQLTVDEVSAWLEEAWGPMAAEGSMEFASAVEERALRRQAVELVRTYLASAPADERPLAVEAVMETPLVDPISGEDLGIPLVGIVDLVVEQREGPVIVDYKTTARSAEPLEIAHEIQLTSYAYLFQHVAARQEAALEIRSLVKTKIPKVQTHRYPARSAAHFRRLLAVVRAYLDDLDAGRFVFRPGLGCSMCDFQKTHCRSWCG